MSHCSTPAIVVRRRSYGDYDVIVTLLTRDFGLRTLIAKAAKKSVKRFGGLLEPFTELQVIFRLSGGKGLSVLEEASLRNAHESLRVDFLKTTYASYWAELIALWSEEKQENPNVYHLLAFSLESLAENRIPPMALSVLFQMRFIGMEGIAPVLERCTCCQEDISTLQQQWFCIDLSKGGIVCQQCPVHGGDPIKVSRGTLKQLQWIAAETLETACRMRFSPTALNEATRFLEAFVPFHIGRTPKSLALLQQMRV